MKAQKHTKKSNKTVPFERIVLNNFKRLEDQISNVKNQLSDVRLSVLDVKDKVENVQKQVRLLPTKDEYFRKMDEVVTELQTTRDEQIVMKGQIGDHEDRLETVEARLKISPKS